MCVKIGTQQNQNKKEIIFCQHLSLRHLRACVYLQFVTNNDPSKPNFIPDLYGKKQERSKTFFKGFQEVDKMNADESSNYAQMFRKNESFFITIVNEQGTSDNIIGGIQFKMSDGGTWINYMGVVDGEVKKSVFGSIVEQFEPNTNFRRIGIGLLLLQIVQLYACSKAFCPNLHIRATNGYILSDLS